MEVRNRTRCLGGEGFRGKVMRYFGLMRDEHSRHERNRLRPPAEWVQKVVAQEYGKGEEELRTSQRGEANEGRKVGMYLMKRLCEMTLVEVAREFRVRSYGTVGWACHGMNLKRERDSKFRRRLDNLETAIYQPKI